jgi:hypothetical protein
MKLKLRSKASGEVLPFEAFDLLVDGADLGGENMSMFLPVLLALGDKAAKPACSCYGLGQSHAADCSAWRNGRAKSEGAKHCRHLVAWELCDDAMRCA